MKKVLSILLVLAMVLSIPLAVSANSDPEPVSIPLNYTDGVSFAGKDWRMFTTHYSPTDAAYVFQPVANGADAEVKLDSKYTDGDGNATMFGMMQYKGEALDSYTLSYNIKLNAENKGATYAYFYYQDTLENGRSLMNNMKAAGMLLRVQSGDGKELHGTVICYDKFGNFKANLSAVTSGARYAADFLEGAAANAELAITLTFDKEAKTLTYTAKRTDTNAEQTATFDLTANANAKTAFDAVTTPSAFTIADAATSIPTAPLAAIGGVTLKNNAPAGEPASIPLNYTDGVSFAGKDWRMFTTHYSPTDAAYVFQPVANGADAEVRLDSKYTDGDGNATMFGMMQYKGEALDSYTLSYNVKLNAENKGATYAYFYYQDTLANGRSLLNNMKAAGMLLRIQSGDGKELHGTVICYDKFGNFKANLSAVTSGARYAADFLEGAAANAELAITLTFDKEAKTLTYTAKRTDTNAEQTATFDLIANANAKTAFDAVTTPSAFTIADAAASIPTAPLAAIGNVKLTNNASSVQPVETTDYTFALNDVNFGALTEGDQFVLNSNGWFTRSANVATENAIVTSTKSVSYNYELFFRLKFDASNKGRFGVWNIWSGSYASTKFGYMLVICTETDGTLGYRLCRYGSNYSLANTLATDETKDNLAGSTILQGQPANAEMLVKITVQDKTLSVVTSLASDPTKTTGTVTYDLSAETQSVIHKNVDRTLGYSFIDMALSANGGATASASFGNVTYKSLPGEAPVDPGSIDTNDYNAILASSFAWDSALTVNENAFKIYTADGGDYEKFSVENGWLTRKDEAGDLLKEENANKLYANAQYTGVMAEGDYKLTFHTKLNADNTCRFNVMTRWNDKDDLSYVNFRSQEGFRVYFRTEDDSILHIVCYKTGGGYVAPATATKDNAAKLSLAGLPANAELVITLVMKDNLIVAEAHLASDATKTSGPVAFDLTDAPELLAKVDKTQGFVLVDAATELRCAPASFGEFHLYAATAPTEQQSGNGEEFDPDDLITTGKEEKPTAPVNEETTPAPIDETTAPTEQPKKKKGCGSSVSASVALVLIAACGGAVVLGKKKKKD